MWSTVTNKFGGWISRSQDALDLDEMLEKLKDWAEENVLIQMRDGQTPNSEKSLMKNFKPNESLI